MPAGHLPRNGRGRPFSLHAMDHAINVRVTADQLAAFNRLGGNGWLREVLETKIAADEVAPLPCAHQPFPTGPDRFTQNQCRITSDQHPGDKGGPTGY